MSDIRLEEKKVGEFMSCPNGHFDLVFKYNTYSGHGDCSYTDGRIYCTKCTWSFGNYFDYGDPSDIVVKNAVLAWNMAISNILNNAT